jgi:hypothetical protein
LEELIFARLRLVDFIFNVSSVVTMTLRYFEHDRYSDRVRQRTTICDPVLVVTGCDETDVAKLSRN